MTIANRFDAFGKQCPVSRFDSSATFGRSTRIAPVRRNSRHRPCGAKGHLDLRFSIAAFASIRVTYSGETCGPRTINSPISPTCQFVDLFDCGDGLVRIRITRQSIGIELVAHAYACSLIRLRRRFMQNDSAASIVETGKHSVAP